MNEGFALQVWKNNHWCMEDTIFRSEREAWEYGRSKYGESGNPQLVVPCKWLGVENGENSA